MAKDDGATKNGKGKTAKFFSFIGFILSCVLFGALLVNSLLAIFKEDYYNSFGGNRLFAIITDSMENPADRANEIPAGSLITCKVPESKDEIKVGTVITYKLKALTGKTIMLITHRVIAVNTDKDGNVTYTTKGDNPVTAPSEDGTHPEFADVVGIYTGKKTEKLGFVVGFIQSRDGAIALIIIIFIIAFTALTLKYLSKVGVLRESAIAALKKLKKELSKEGSAQTGIIGTIINVHEPEDRETYKNSVDRLERYAADKGRRAKSHSRSDDDFDYDFDSRKSRKSSYDFDSSDSYNDEYGDEYGGDDYGDSYDGFDDDDGFDDEFDPDLDDY